MSSVRGVVPRVVAIVLASVLGAGTGTVHAQGRPSGDGRIWLELGLAASRLEPNIGGPSLTVAGGVTLHRGVGVAVLGRAFDDFSFESSQLHSRYVVALAQYAPPRVSLLSLNAGAGWARHSSSIASNPSNGSGAVLYVGSALRLPARSAVALTVVADVLQPIDDSPSRLFSVGLAIGAATKSRPFRE